MRRVAVRMMTPNEIGERHGHRQRIQWPVPVCCCMALEWQVKVQQLGMKVFILTLLQH